MRVVRKAGRHVIFRADSASVEFGSVFDLLLTSPPFFHPRNTNPAHGMDLGTHDLAEYAARTAAILERSSRALSPARVVAIVKTDVYYRSKLIPVGYAIADACMARGLKLNAHWIWQKRNVHSPYSPSFANIFVFCDLVTFEKPRGEVISDVPARRYQNLSSSYTPEVFERLLKLLSEPGSNILDPFCGAGSIVVAASRSGRWAVGVERCPEQIDRARRCLNGIEDIVFSDVEHTTHIAARRY